MTGQYQLYCYVKVNVVNGEIISREIKRFWLNPFPENSDFMYYARLLQINKGNCKFMKNTIKINILHLFHSLIKEDQPTFSFKIQ